MRSLVTRNGLEEGLKRIRPTAPSPIKGRARLSILILNPMVAMIHAVRVVPMLDPMMTPMAFCMFITPAPTKANTMSETAELLCSRAVTKAPLPMDRSLPLVYIRMIRLKALPDKAFTDSSIKSIPNRKMPSPASSFHKSKLNDMLIPMA